MHDQLTLQINKVNISVDRDRLKYDQNERGKIVDVTVLDTDGLKAYDLTGKNIRFFDLKQGTPPKVISDDGSTSTGGKFIRTPENDKLGKFSYQFQEFTYQQSGEAHFEFYTDKDHVDVTSNFAIDIIAEGQIAPDNSSYVSSMAELIDQLKAATDHASDSIGALTTASDAAKKAATDAIQAMRDQVATYATQVTDAQASWTAQSKKINDDAANQLASLKTKDQNEIAATVKSIADQRDAAIYDLNKKAHDQLGSIQSDYSNWKTKTVADFNSTVDPIKKAIEQNSTDVANVTKQVQDTVAQMNTLKQEFDKVDFTKFVTGDTIKNYYTKTEVDNIVKDLQAKIATAGAVKTVDGIQPDSNGNVQTDHYTKSQANQKLATKLSFVKCDSPQAAYDASKKLADDGSIQIGIYDMNDGATSAVIGDKTVTIETLYNALNSLTTTTNSSLTDLQSQINSKTSGTIITAYDIASKTPTKETNSYTNKWLVDQNVLSQFADAINAIRYSPQERKTLGANDDANTISDDGVYRIAGDPIKNGNNETYCFLYVKKWDDNTIFQVLLSSDGINVRNISITKNFYPSWKKIATDIDITNLQNQIQAQQTAIETGYMKKPTVISKADYDKLATKDPNTLYEITE